MLHVPLYHSEQRPDEVVDHSNPVQLATELQPLAHASSVTLLEAIPASGKKARCMYSFVESQEQNREAASTVYRANEVFAMLLYASSEPVESTGFGHHPACRGEFTPHSHPTTHLFGAPDRHPLGVKFCEFIN